MNILLAEDNELICELYQTILGRSGHQFRAVNDGQAAWELFAADQNAFDLVIVDYAFAEIMSSGRNR